MKQQLQVALAPIENADCERATKAVKQTNAVNNNYGHVTHLCPHPVAAGDLALV